MGDFIGELPQALKGIELFLRRLELPLEKIRIVIAFLPLDPEKRFHYQYFIRISHL